MASDNVTKFVLDLDSEDFTKGVGKAYSAIQSLAASDLKGLAASFATVAGAAGVVGAAVFAAKKAFEWTEEADSIKAVSRQFDNLTERVGISGDAMKEALVKAAGGMIDDTDAMKAANEQIIRFGDQAKRLPEIMELARKASALTGRDLTETFESLSTAISNGNARALKQFGIFVDGEKAIKDFARAHGVAAEALNETGRRQAVLNAALDAGKSQLANVQTGLNETKSIVTQLTVTFGQLKEIMVLVFEKTFGPYVKNFLRGVSEMATDLKSVLLRSFDEGIDGTKAKIAKLESDLMQARARIVDADVGARGWIDKLIYGNDKDVTEKAKADIQRLSAEIAKEKEKLSGQSPAAAPMAAIPDSGEVNSRIVNNQKQLELQTKFEADLLRLREERAQKEALLANDDLTANQAILEQKAILEAQYQNTKQQIEMNDSLSRQQKDALLIEQEQLKQQRIQELEMQTASIRMQQLDAYADRATSVADGVGRAFEAGSKKAAIGLTQFGQMGKVVFDSFSKNATNSLLALGAGTQSATEAMRGFFLGMIADTAQAFGQQMLLASVFPPNPAGLAAGAGLIVLAGYLRSQANGKGMSLPNGGGGGGVEDSGFGTRRDIAPQVGANEQQKKMVSLTVQGNYFETDQTRTRIVELIREASDATDFNIKSVGG